MPKKSSTPRILDGVDDIVNLFLELKKVSKSAHYKHKKACQYLSKKSPKKLNGKKLFQMMCDQIARNWDRSKGTHNTQPSKENWRFTKNQSPKNNKKSPEVGLERNIIKIPDERWANQVPTSSGLVGPRVDKRRAIDLVFKRKKLEFEFIELKINANQPLFAAIEIIGYGMIYHFTRNHLNDLGYSNSDKEILKAKHIHLKVLAPRDYYEPYDMRWLEEMLGRGLMEFHSSKEWKMDFRFERLPEPITTATKEIDSQLARAAIKGRRPLYP